LASKSYKITPDEGAKIPSLVNEGGVMYAAAVVGVSPATISRWLKTNGCAVQTVWVLTPAARAALEAARNNAPISQGVSE